MPPWKVRDNDKDEHFLENKSNINKSPSQMSMMERNSIILQSTS